MDHDQARDHPETVPPEARNGTHDRLHDVTKTASSRALGESRDVQCDRMTVPEAAEALKVTQSAIRKRIQRGTIPWDKDSEGRVYVYVDPSETSPETGQNPSRESVTGPSRDELVDELRDQVGFLRAELERKDTILMSLMQRIPELEPPREDFKEPPESSETNLEGSANGSPQVSEESGQRRSWWRSFFSFER